MILMSAIIAVMTAVIIGFGAFKRINVYQMFTSGVRNGFESVASVFPALMAVFVGVAMFRSSGLAEFITGILSPVARLLHFPAELLPFAILRPVSGSGALALASGLFAQYGPDSYIGQVASVMMGSTETTFYTVAVYFGACGIKNIRYTLKCALMADAFGMILSIIAVNLINM